MPNKGQTKLNRATLKSKAEEYLNKCKDDNKVPLLKELCYSLGISDETLTRYKGKSEFMDIIKKVESAQEIALVRKGIDDNKPVFSIFMLKSKHNYQEASKLDITSNGASIGVVQLPTIPE